jgi:hypothetical protein
VYKTRQGIPFHESIIPPATGADILVFRYLHVLSLTFAGGAPPAGDEVDTVPFLGRLASPALDALHLNFECEASIMWDGAAFTAFQSRAPNIHPT